MPDAIVTYEDGSRVLMDPATGASVALSPPTNVSPERINPRLGPAAVGLPNYAGFGTMANQLRVPGLAPGTQVPADAGASPMQAIRGFLGAMLGGPSLPQPVTPAQQQIQQAFASAGRPMLAGQLLAPAAGAINRATEASVDLANRTAQAPRVMTGAARQFFQDAADQALQGAPKVGVAGKKIGKLQDMLQQVALEEKWAPNGLSWARQAEAKTAQAQIAKLLQKQAADQADQQAVQQFASRLRQMAGQPTVPDAMWPAAKAAAGSGLDLLKVALKRGAPGYVLFDILSRFKK